MDWIRYGFCFPVCEAEIRTQSIPREKWGRERDGRGGEREREGGRERGYMD